MISVRYHFFCCCIGLFMGMTLFISNCSSMMSYFIMITLCFQLEMANKPSDIIIL